MSYNNKLLKNVLFYTFFALLGITVVFMHSTYISKQKDRIIEQMKNEAIEHFNDILVTMS